MTKIAQGTAHTVPPDMKKALIARPKDLETWNGLTPLARNEWICWVVSVKQEETRKDHIRQIRDRFKEGQRRPCCWAGCPHRKDKAPSPAQKYAFGKRTKK